MQFQTYGGPSDKRFKNDEVSGYQPVSRIGEVVINAFVDPNEFAELASKNAKLSDLKVSGSDDREPVPHFHEWATVLPGMICITRKNRHMLYRNNLSAETAVPCLASATGIYAEDGPIPNQACHTDFFFAGVARSKSIREYDDGLGPTTDEYFTLTIGGMATVLNTSREAITPGQLILWTSAVVNNVPGDKLYNSKSMSKTAGPRRVGIVGTNEVNNAREIGRVRATTTLPCFPKLTKTPSPFAAGSLLC